MCVGSLQQGSEAGSPQIALNLSQIGTKKVPGARYDHLMKNLKTESSCAEPTLIRHFEMFRCKDWITESVSASSSLFSLPPPQQ